MFLESPLNLLKPISQKSNVHFMQGDNREHLKSAGQRIVSPVPFSSGMRYRTNSGSNFIHPVGSHPTGSHGLLNHHILSVDMFNKQQLREIFSLADTFKQYVRKERQLDHVMKVINYFLYYCTQKT